MGLSRRGRTGKVIVCAGVAFAKESAGRAGGGRPPLAPSSLLAVHLLQQSPEVVARTEGVEGLVVTQGPAGLLEIPLVVQLLQQAHRPAGVDVGQLPTLRRGKVPVLADD